MRWQRAKAAAYEILWGLERDDRLLPFPEFISTVTRHYCPPIHLSAYTDAIAETAQRELRLCLSVPPRHGKTETTLHAFPWLWSQQPERTHCYVTYEADLARSKSRRVQQLAREAGFTVEGNLNDWRTSQGGRFLATGAGGPLTGRGVDGLLVVDDPVKNRQDAESFAIRNRIHDWARDVAFTRLEPGASCLVIQTRWHVDDPAGRLAAEGWPVINIPAVQCDTITGYTDEAVLMSDGRALWPERWPLDVLERRRKLIGEHTWASLYQGRPRPRGAVLFGEPHYYHRLPDSGYRVAHGVDLAYTSRTHADWSVCVTLLITGQREKALYYVVNVERKQCEAPKFVPVLEAQQKANQGPMWWHCSGTEKGAAQFMLRRLPKLRPVVTTADKYTRALPASEAWNSGRILVPEKAPWLQAFLEVVQGFTGISDPVDDDVDALSSAVAAAQTAVVAYRRPTGDGLRWRF